MHCEIRESISADLPLLREIFLRSRAATFTWLDPQTLQAADFDEATQGEPILVAVVPGDDGGEQLAGFVSWWPPEDFVHNLFVDPRYQRQGIGPRLLEACLARVGRPATLKCVRQNAGALRFYERHGWRVIGEGTSPSSAYYLLEFAG